MRNNGKVDYELNGPPPTPRDKLEPLWTTLGIVALIVVPILHFAGIALCVWLVGKVLGLL